MQAKKISSYDCIKPFQMIELKLYICGFRTTGRVTVTELIQGYQPANSIPVRQPSSPARSLMATEAVIDRDFPLATSRSIPLLGIEGVAQRLSWKKIYRIHT
jgi:hypothetical protein